MWYPWQTRVPCGLVPDPPPRHSCFLGSATSTPALGPRVGSTAKGVHKSDQDSWRDGPSPTIEVSYLFDSETLRSTGLLGRSGRNLTRSVHPRSALVDTRPTRHDPEPLTSALQRSRGDRGHKWRAQESRLSHE